MVFIVAANPAPEETAPPTLLGDERPKLGKWAGVFD
jgi:hypothetical protein